MSTLSLLLLLVSTLFSTGLQPFNRNVKEDRIKIITSNYKGILIAEKRFF